jgi:hypothetical protein
MGEREQGKELIGRGELFFLSHPGMGEIFSGYGLTVKEESKGNLVGVLMVDRPRTADPKWLKQVESNFGEYQLVPMTATGERGIICQMKIENDSLHCLRQYSSDKASAIREVLKPLLDNRPGPKFILSWNEETHLWRSRIVRLDDHYK